jgi:hypothetical protein
MKSKLFLNTDQNEILKIINNLQIKHDYDPFFEEGLWPSYRYSRLFNFHVPDNNIFFSLSIVVLLKKFAEKNPDMSSIVNKMAEHTQKQLNAYKNKDGKVSYNFWRTKPSQHFPHGKIFKHFDYWRLPDDLDDTSLALLFKKHSDSELEEFVFLCSEHANLAKKSIQKIDSKYQKIPAFSTFFGINMPIEFDVVVISNALSVFFEYQLKLSKEAEASLILIEQMLKDGYLLSNPFQASPNYARSSIIYYHLVKMCYFYPNDALKKIEKLLKNDIGKIKINDPLDDVLLTISKMMLKMNSAYESKLGFNPNKKHPFFIAGMFSAFEGRFFQNIADKPFSHIKYNCETYNYCLELLSIILKKD